MTNPAPLVLHHARHPRGGIALWMLEEVGAVYELAAPEPDPSPEADSSAADEPGWMAPELECGEARVQGVAAICAYLASSFAAAGLGIPMSDPQRGLYLRWLCFAPACLEPAVLQRDLTRARLACEPSAPSRELRSVLGVLDAGLERGPYLLGERFTAADVVIGGELRWTRILSPPSAGRSGLGRAPAGSGPLQAISEHPRLRAYLAHLDERPALRRSRELQRELGAPAPA